MKMKKIVTLLLLAGFMAACGDEDNDSQPANNNQQNQEQTNDSGSNQQNQGTNGSSSANDSTQTSTDSTAASNNIALAVTFSGTAATIDGETDSLSITQEGANVTITSVAQRSLDITLKGSTTNGSLMVFAEKKYALTLDNVTITNPNGPAINNQCSKALTLTLKGSNTLSDGTTYATTLTDIDQKGTLFSEGQIYVKGSGSLTINGNAKNGMASDDYIIVESGTIQVSMSTTASNGIKVNDGFDIKGGTLTIDVKAKGARGIKSDAYATFNGGTTTITTSGDCLIETVSGVKDTTSCAGIKCDSMFVMNAGTLTITSTGDGGKGINSAQNIEMNGGTLTVTTKGSNDEGKPKAVKSDTAIILRGGSFTASTAKSWACDNGTSSDDPNDHQTIVGTPGTKSIAKKLVKVIF